MDALPGTILAAALLGGTHAAEPDHVAGIVSLAADADRTRAAVVGACFAVGHVLLVLVWIALGTLALSRLPATGTLTSFGSAALGTALLSVAAVTALRGRRRLRGAPEDDRGHGHAHCHARSPRSSAPTVTDGGHRRVHEYLTVGTVGAAFTLSPPLSMLAFVTGVLPTTSTGDVLAVVGAYAVGIGVVMTVIGAVSGTAFDALSRYGDRTHASVQLLAASATGLLGVAVLLGVV